VSPVGLGDLLSFGPGPLRWLGGTGNMAVTDQRGRRILAISLYTEVDNAVTTVDNVPHFPDFWVTGIARKDQPVEFQSGVRI